MVENLQTIPGFSRRGHIEEGEENASDNLKPERCERGAAKDVSPACRFPRDWVLHRLPDRRRQLKALIEPVTHFWDHAHGGFPRDMFIRFATGAPVVGILPALMSNF